MMLQKSQTKLSKNLDFYILWYSYQLMELTKYLPINVTFDNKTILFALRGLGYQKNYIAMTLSKLVRIKYLNEPEIGVYKMTEDCFEIIKVTNPEFAKEIKSKLTYDKTVNWQKSSC